AISPGYHGSIAGQRGRVQIGRCRLAHPARRCQRCHGPLCADADAGVMGQPRVVPFAPLSPRPTGGPHVAWLRLSNFRCYEQAQLETDHRPVVLSGPNGAGKTNLLEALSFLAPGRGLRQARLGDIDRRGAGGAAAWAVAARLSGPEGDCDIGTGRDPVGDDSARERRLLRIDGAPHRGLAGLAERLSLLWLTPQIDGLFLESRSA